MGKAGGKHGEWKGKAKVIDQKNQGRKRRGERTVEKGEKKTRRAGGNGKRGKKERRENMGGKL